MNTQKHTPGEWSTHGSHIYAPDLAIIATVYNPGSREADYPLIANRDVMAAAPDMLASERENLTVLENLLAYLRKHEATLPPLSTSSLEVRIEKTRAAIRKAEGGAS